MLRRSFRARRFYHLPLRHPRRFSSSSKNSVEPPNSLQNPRPAPSTHPPPSPPKILQRSLSHSTSAASSRYLTRNSALALSAAVAAGSYAILSNSGYDQNPNSNALYTSIENAVHRSNESVKRIVHHARQTGVAASVLWKSLRSVLSSANHEMRTGFELRVASLLADIASANSSRREALVRAGSGAVVDWLLETVAVAPEGCGTQAEAARALAYLLADPDVRHDVLGRPGAVPNLLKFIFLCQPQNQSKQHSRRSSFSVSDSLKGRSMLVTAIMDIVTSNSDSLDKALLRPLLPANAETRDIAAAIQVIEEGGFDLVNPERNGDDEDGGRGMKGIGIKILEGTTALGLARDNALIEVADRNTARTLALLNKHHSSLAQANFSSSVVPGVWDDLHSQHVAVPFAAWALANWAMASETNRSNIRDLDKDGGAVMTALLAPERSVKWHGCLVAHLLLEDRNLPLNASVSDWASTLLSTLSQASKTNDISLVQMALSAFLVSVERSPGAQKVVMEKGLHLMRDVTKRTSAHQKVQESLAKALELLSTGDLRLSLDESQRWSGILLSWIFGKVYSIPIHSSATRILSCILEDYGPYSVPVSQGWLALVLNAVLSSNKTSSSTKASTSPKGDDKLRTQIDQSAAQIANQLAVSVVNLAGNQLGTRINSQDSFPLADLLSLEPFAGPYKIFKKDNPPKFDVADAASAALKGIKSLAEISAEDVLCQNKITDYGILCLLRHFLLRDDYEKLAAFEAYDASRTHETQERGPNNTDESSPNTNGPSSLRVPDTAHIRRHAARLLAILSLLPKVKKLIMEDETWCRWLEDCAAGKIPGSSDLKIRSYARATLLNVLCDQQSEKNSSNGGPINATGAKRASNCPRYRDSIFLVNPELRHWKCPESREQSAAQEGFFPPQETNLSDNNDTSTVDDSSTTSENCRHSSSSESPSLDIVFVHGLRGGPFKTWRLADDKTSTKSGLVEKIDEEAGKLGTFWPGEWLPADFPEARIFSLKYKTNLTQWSGASLPLQEVSSMLLNKLVAAGIGNRPVVFVTHSMGGLVVKQMLFKAKTENIDKLVTNTVGVVFYSCPHFGSKLADMPWRMGLVLRPAPTIGELRSGSPRLIQLNDFLRHLHKKGMVEVLSFCETQVTPIVEGYGGWAFRMEIVPIESAYPGFGDLVVLESSDHINSCKPLDRADRSYAETVEFLRKLKTAQHMKK